MAKNNRVKRHSRSTCLVVYFPRHTGRHAFDKLERDGDVCRGFAFRMILSFYVRDLMNFVDETFYLRFATLKNNSDQ